MAISARIDELKKKFDENPRRYFASLANEYRKAGDLEQALFICQEYLPQQPGHMSGHIVLAQTLYEMAKFPEAKAEFESALALDPENLIALRHLGDIARQAGDPRTARNWYQRVLEADPRNSEIVDVLATLRTTPMVSSAAISAIPPTPLSTPVMPPPTRMVEPPVRMPTPVEAASPVHEHELLDFEEITLGETPLSTPVVKPNAAPESTSESTPLSLVSSFPAVEHDDPFGAEPPSEGVAFEPDSFAIAATGSPEIESATDIDFGLIETNLQPASPEEIKPEIIEGLRSYEAGTLIKGVDPIDKSLETEPYYDVLHGTTRSTPPEPGGPESTPPSDDDFMPEFTDNLVVDSHEHAGASVPARENAPTIDETATDQHFETRVVAATPVLASTPVVSTPVVSAPVEAVEPPPASPAPTRAPTPTGASEIFVTETMAELYLHQGHLDSALDIYRKLYEHHPDDPRLAEQVRSVEARVSGRVARQATPQQAVAVAPTGPTIREFLVHLLASSGNGSERLEHSSATDELVSGSIDALFPGADTSPSDSAAAAALADAFSASDPDKPMLEGQPSHRATNELSLDQVFKVATPVRMEAQPQGFSFDQFFAGEATASPPSPPNTNTPPAEGTDDIAQFNAWLNGLKKT